MNNPNAKLALGDIVSFHGDEREIGFVVQVEAWPQPKPKGGRANYYKIHWFKTGYDARYYSEWVLVLK